MPLASKTLTLADEVAACYGYPLRFVRTMYPWGSGILAGHAGPDTWQTEFLDWVGQQVRARKFKG